MISAFKAKSKEQMKGSSQFLWGIVPFVLLVTLFWGGWGSLFQNPKKLSSIQEKSSVMQLYDAVSNWFKKTLVSEK